MGRVRPLEVRFWEKVDKSGECWEWLGARTAPGWHGRISVGGRAVMAHRVAWEMAYGPVPAGLSVLHSCDNPGCVRADHLMLGTQRANMRDASNKGRTGSQRRDWSRCKRGHELTGDNVYIHPGHGRRLCRACIKLRNDRRNLGVFRPKPGAHQPVPDQDGRCLTCGEVLVHGNMGRCRIGWRHSRWAGHASGATTRGATCTSSSDSARTPRSGWTPPSPAENATTKCARPLDK